MEMGSYSLGVKLGSIVLASTVPGTDGLHTNVLTGGGGGALHHLHIGVDGHLEVVEAIIRMEPKVTWRQHKHGSGLLDPVIVVHENHKYHEFHKKPIHQQYYEYNEYQQHH